jgi:hypothetical protein
LEIAMRIRHSPGLRGRLGRGAEKFRVRADSSVVEQVDHCQARIVVGRSVSLVSIAAVVVAMSKKMVSQSRT